MSDDRLCVLAHFEIRPEMIDQFKALVSALGSPTRLEAGCISYRLQQNLAEPSRFVFIEEWESEADLAHHLSTPHVSALSAHLPDMLLSPPAVVRFRLLW